MSQASHKHGKREQPQPCSKRCSHKQDTFHQPCQRVRPTLLEHTLLLGTPATVVIVVASTSANALVDSPCCTGDQGVAAIHNDMQAGLLKPCCSVSFHLRAAVEAAADQMGALSTRMHPRWPVRVARVSSVGAAEAPGPEPAIAHRLLFYICKGQLV